MGTLLVKEREMFLLAIDGLWGSFAPWIVRLWLAPCNPCRQSTPDLMNLFTRTEGRSIQSVPITVTVMWTKSRRRMTKPTSWLSRNLIAFFLFGLVNNVIYVIFLSAAEDILRSEGGAEIRKSSVLLADILPCFLVKLVSPYFVRVVPYGYMITTAVTLSLAALTVVALVPTVPLRFLGIILCSISCGLGETAFLALTTYFDPKTVVAWSSGTGAAGIVGSVYYWFFSSIMELSMQSALLIATVLPFLMASAYIFLLKEECQETLVATSSPRECQDYPNNGEDEEDEANDLTVIKIEQAAGESIGFWAHINMIRPLIWRYILPLLLVYYAEYCINQSVYFALLYPLPQTPFNKYRDHYKTYSAIYQIGVFISRTLGRLVSLRNCWIFVALQGAILAILSTETLFSYLGSIYVVFGLIFVEGLLGGAAYVKTYCNITEQVERRNLEFSMAFTGIADSLGILLAGLTCLFYEPFLCAHNSVCSSLRALS